MHASSRAVADIFGAKTVWFVRVWWAKAGAPQAVGSAMADIFISYSDADHALALKLSAFLEAEGWSVWWDKSLGDADLYRDEIMKQLAAARAVISIWTSNSIRSDWVRAEAGTAKREGKLIPVKTPDVAYADIPLPFGEMHTENVASTDLIRAAVVAQLAKPAVQPTAWALLTKGSKYEILTWVGIVGGALTLFGNLDAVLKLADWARLLVQSWKEWTHAFWLWAFGWLGIHLPPEWTPVLSFLLFGSLLTIGQAIQFKRTVKNQLTEDKYQGKSFELRTALKVVILGPICAIVCFAVLLVIPIYRPFERVVAPIYIDYFLWLSFFVLPLVILVIWVGRNRLNAGISLCLMIIFWVIITFSEIANSNEGRPAVEAFYTAIAMIWVLPLILLSVAPAKAVSRRLIFLAIGLILLIALNELSKLGLDVIAPKPKAALSLLIDCPRHVTAAA
jgi:hypothetical protein